MDTIVKTYSRSEDVVKHDTSNELENCVKCGKKYMPRLIKPLTICEKCSDELRKDIEISYIAKLENLDIAKHIHIENIDGRVVKLEKLIEQEK